MSTRSSKASSDFDNGSRKFPPLLPKDSRDVVDARLSGDAQVGADSIGDGSQRIYDSPTTFSTQSRRPEPPLNTLRTRKTKTPTTATPQSAQSLEQQLEKRKKSIANRSLSNALQRSVLHVLPALVTVMLFVLSAKEVYMSDLYGFPGQDILLQALQFVAKGHEILMTMSLGDVVLHRIRWDLIVAAGVPFGLLSAAYQLGDLGYLFSTEFRASVWRPSSHDPSLSRLTLSLLVIVSCLLALVVGPSSGVLLIPKLSWWPLKEPFGSTTLRVFASNGSQNQYWPRSLPGYFCGDLSWVCPEYGAKSIGVWAGSMLDNDASGQLPFIDGGDNFYRWLRLNATGRNGWTVSTSPMMTMCTLLGETWDWISFQKLAPTVSLKQPQLSLSFADQEQVLQPLVQVQCSAHHSSSGIFPSLNIPNDRLRTKPAGAYSNVVWPLPSNYTNVDLADINYYLFADRIPIDGHANAPSTALVFVMQDENYYKTVVPCSVLAHWVPSELSVFPHTNRSIYDTFSDPGNIVNLPYVDLSPSAALTFSENWWAMFTSHTSIAHLFAGIAHYTDGCDRCTYFPSKNLAYRVSAMISMYLTDALARYTPQDSQHVVAQHTHLGDKFAQDLGYFYSQHEAVPKGYSSWLRYIEETDPTGWRELTFPVQRFGYAWSFTGLLSKFAGAALLIQSLFALAHVAIVLSGRWTSTAWDSMGAMLALALRSRSPAVPPDHRTGGERKETWAEKVSVRVVGNELDLMFHPSRAETLRWYQR